MKRTVALSLTKKKHDMGNCLFPWCRALHRVFFLLLLVMVIGAGVFRYLSRSQIHVEQGVSQLPVQIEPDHIEIPRLGVTAFLDVAGVDAANRMAAPSDPSRISVFEYGPQPGEEGQVVFAGHVDDPAGLPAVFAELHTLKVNDQIIVYFNQQKYVYQVTDIQKLKDTAANAAQVFAYKEGKHANFITCAGEWDDTTNAYTDRVVVFTTLQGTE